MSNWSVQNAKARFSELLDTCIHEAPQIVTKRGKKVAVLVSIEEWQRLQNQARPTLKQLLLDDNARFDELPIPQRGVKSQGKRRSIPMVE